MQTFPFANPNGLWGFRIALGSCTGAVNGSALQISRPPDPGPGAACPSAKRGRTPCPRPAAFPRTAELVPRRKAWPGADAGPSLVSWESQRFHCAHSHLPPRGQTSGQRAPQLGFSQAEPQPGREGPAGPGHWPGQAFLKPRGSGRPVEGLGRFQVLGEKRSAPRGTSLVGTRLGKSGRAQCRSGTRPGAQGSRAHTPHLGPRLPEHPVHLRPLLRRLLGVEGLQLLEDGRGVIVVPVLGALVPGQTALGVAVRESMEDRLGVRLGPAPRGQGQRLQLHPETRGWQQLLQGLDQHLLGDPGAQQGAQEFLLERRELGHHFPRTEKEGGEGVRGWVGAREEGGGEFHKRTPSPGTPPPFSLQTPVTPRGPESPPRGVRKLLTCHDRHH